MIFKKRIIKKEGGTEIRLSLFVTDEEMDGVDKVKADPNLGLDSIRTKSWDEFLCWLRILIDHVELWNNRDKFKSVILNNITMRKSREAKDETKRRKEKRVRRNRKAS